MGCASSAPALSRNGDLKSAADGLIQEGADLASRAKKSANDLMDAAGDAKDETIIKLQGKSVMQKANKTLILHSCVFCNTKYRTDVNVRGLRTQKSLKYG
jgi:hypothetical protein